MSSKIVLSRITAQQALEYKKQLDADGLKLDQDYFWRYRPVKYNNEWSLTPIEDSCVEFEFNSDALSSFYRLKWEK